MEITRFVQNKPYVVYVIRTVISHLYVKVSGKPILATLFNYKSYKIGQQGSDDDEFVKKFEFM